MLPFFDSTVCVEQGGSDSFVNRTNELDMCIYSICHREKAIIIGERGVGKSALIKRIEYKLKNDYPEILPIYIQFSPEIFNGNSHYGCIYHLLISLIRYIWSDILCLKWSSIFDESGTVSNELARAVQSIHKLTRIITENQAINRKKEIETAFFVKGNINKTTEQIDNLNPLSNQEMLGLLSELCEYIIEYTETKNLAFLCDEANRLDEALQLEIERDLANIFPELHCSFLYVASISSFNPHMNPHIDNFEKVIYVEGFRKVQHSKELLENRILQKEFVEIDEEVYEIIHGAAHGNPRYLIVIMGEVMSKKILGEESKRQGFKVKITAHDAIVSCENFLKQQAILQKIYTFNKD